VARGNLDALMLARQECPACIEDERDRSRHNAHMCEMCGCVMAVRCEGICGMAADIADSPYDDQIGRQL
jgi:hypothetical protein